MTQPVPAPTISVVLPTYNRAQVLPRAMRSVLDQSYGDLELIIVDDASSDGTEQIVRSFDDPRIRYFRHEQNRGAPAARNLGAREARGRLIAFQDSDDDWLIGKLEKQMATLAVSGGADVVFCAFIRSGDGRRQRVPGPGLQVRDGNLLPQLLHENFVSTQTLLITRELLDEVGGFDETLGRFQDWDLAIRLAAVARFRLVDEPLVIVHDTPGSISTDDVAGAAALHTMVNTHRSLYERYPVAMASALAGMGHLQCLSGDLAGGRRHFRQALRITPYSPKFWAALLLSLLGARAYRHIYTARSRARSSARDRAPA